MQDSERQNVESRYRYCELILKINHSQIVDQTKQQNDSEIALQINSQTCSCIDVLLSACDATENTYKYYDCQSHQVICLIQTNIIKRRGLCLLVGDYHL